MFDTFDKLETVEQKLKYLDDTFTPLVEETLTQFKSENNLPGKFIKDLYFNKDSRYEITYELADGAKCVVRVMLYSDFDDHMQEYFWVYVYLPWAVDGSTKSLSKEDLLDALRRLKKASEKS